MVAHVSHPINQVSTLHGKAKAHSTIFGTPHQHKFWGVRLPTNRPLSFLAFRKFSVIFTEEWGYDGLGSRQLWVILGLPREFRADCGTPL